MIHTVNLVQLAALVCTNYTVIMPSKVTSMTSIKGFSYFVPASVLLPVASFIGQHLNVPPNHAAEIVMIELYCCGPGDQVYCLLPNKEGSWVCCKDPCFASWLGW